MAPRAHAWLTLPMLKFYDSSTKEWKYMFNVINWQIFTAIRRVPWFYHILLGIATATIVVYHWRSRLATLVRAFAFFTKFAEQGEQVDPKIARDQVKVKEPLSLSILLSYLQMVIHLTHNTAGNDNRTSLPFNSMSFKDAPLTSADAF